MGIVKNLRNLKMNRRTLFMVSIICASHYNCLATDENDFEISELDDLTMMGKVLDDMLHDATRLVGKNAEKGRTKEKEVEKFGVLPKKHLAELKQRAENIKSDMDAVVDTNWISIFRDIQNFINLMEENKNIKDEL